MKQLNTFKVGLIALSSITLFALSGCSTSESHQVLETQSVASDSSVYSGVKTNLVVGDFDNHSTYMNGVFSSGENQLGSQAKTILKTALQKTNRFTISDRDSLTTLKQEANYKGAKQNIVGARYVVTGDISEFGRKVTGDKQFFGIFGKGKKQTVYAKAILNLVDVENAQIVYSTEASGEYSLSNREIVGFGGTAGYDSTLNGKVLSLAISKAVDNMAKDMDSGKLTLQTK